MIKELREGPPVAHSPYTLEMWDKINELVDWVNKSGIERFDNIQLKYDTGEAAVVKELRVINDILYVTIETPVNEEKKDDQETT